MKRLLVACAALLLWGSSAFAQNVLETQAAVPLGGADIRGLPDRTQLPPMFGANLFSRLATPGGSTGGTGDGSKGGSSPSSSNSNAGSAGGANGASAASGGNDMAAVVAQAIAAGQRPNTIPGTTVQPPGGMSTFDPAHVMAPGDVVQIHIYGATTLDQQATVDSNGDIFLPSIGPVHVAGTVAGSLQSVVAAAIASVYESNAQVYVTLATAVPVNVFVTGGVVSPGQYAQPSTSSVITFLQMAGGVDPKRGSYRDIHVLRNGRPIATVDLYEFLLHGRLPPLRLQDRDTILVGVQGATVAALGDVTGVFRYELTQSHTGEQLNTLARPYPDATRVSVLGIRHGRPLTSTYTLPDFRRAQIENGDVITYTPDTPTNVMGVKFEGRIDGPTSLVVSRQTTLYDVLPYLPVDPYFSDVSSIYVRRVSVAQAQQKAIQNSMQRLKAQVVTSPTITAEQAQMQQEEAKVIFQFAEQLSNVKPEGRLVVDHGGRLENVRLEDGDVIVVPSRTDLVLVSGEVRVPQAIVWVRGANLKHYIKTAGGFTERANDSRILILRPSGEAIMDSDTPITAGDRIIVLPASSNWTIPLIKDITQIIYQIAVTTGVALTLN